MAATPTVLHLRALPTPSLVAKPLTEGLTQRRETLSRLEPASCARCGCWFYRENRFVRVCDGCQSGQGTFDRRACA